MYHELDIKRFCRLIDEADAVLPPWVKFKLALVLFVNVFKKGRSDEQDADELEERLNVIAASRGFLSWGEMKKARTI